MAIHEEQNPPEKINWRAHMARERQGLSESVEQTLADNSSLDEWSDDEQEYVPVDPTQSRADLVPPRISLQSKVQPSVRPESFVKSATSEIAAQQDTARRQEEQEKRQNQGILARLAQRFTASIAAIMQPEEVSWEPSPRETYQEAPASGMNQETPAERHLTPLPPPYQPQPRTDNTTRIIDAIPAPSSTSPGLSTVKSKQRLAGHTGKVRLETAEIAKVQKPFSNDSDIYGWHRETNEPLREPLTVNIRLREKPQEQEVAPPSQPVEVPLAKETPLPEKPPVRAASIPVQRNVARTFFGAGTFERGQGEVMIRNEHVTEMGVVHVTLTSNPGATLMQYVSLHPEVGFTLHLTAPAETKTTFNYVLFVDETSAEL